MVGERILEIDAGNSAFKWRLKAANEVMASGRATRENFVPVIASVVADLQQGVRVRARVVSVAGQDSEMRIREYLSEAGIAQVAFARVSSPVGNIVCGYSDFSQLGVDRWMAILAAASDFSGPIVVADFGTALTLDFIDANKQHLGGYIFPGWSLMQQALLQGTAIDADRIPGPFESELIVPGRSSRGAVGMGRLHMLSSTVDQAVISFERQQHSKALLVCTGGDAPLLAPHIVSEKVMRVDLVMDGLALALD